MRQTLGDLLYVGFYQIKAFLFVNGVRVRQAELLEQILDGGHGFRFRSAVVGHQELLLGGGGPLEGHDRQPGALAAADVVAVFAGQFRVAEAVEKVVLDLEKLKKCHEVRTLLY